MELWGWYPGKSERALYCSVERLVSDDITPIISTEEEMDDAYLEQQGLCALCSVRAEFVEHLAADHCHETGRFRGWLCQHCNWGLGFFYEFPLRTRVLLGNCGGHIYYERFLTVSRSKILDYLEPFVPTFDEKWYPHVINVHLEITY